MQVSSYTIVTGGHLVCKYAISDDSWPMVCYRVLALTLNILYILHFMHVNGFEEIIVHMPTEQKFNK